MSLDNKISKTLNPDKFYLKPLHLPKKLIHLYADYVELTALIYNGDFATPSNIASRYRVEKIEDEDSNDDHTGSRKAEEDDDIEIFFDSVFDIMEERTERYGKFYPFEVLPEGVKIKLGAAQNEKMKLYLALLLSSNLNYFNQFEPELTTEFEEISFKVLCNYLPQTPKSITKQFGKNSDYTGSAEKKIKALAKDLNIPINEDEIFGVVDGNQERGLDIIGWVPFHDQIPNMFVIMVQCACGKEWHKKLNETERYENYYRFYRLKPIHAMFIPYALVKNNTEFYQRDELTSSKLLFERGRILQFIEDASFIKTLDSNRIVERCIAFQEDVV